MRSFFKSISKVFAKEDLPSLIYLEILFGILISLWSVLIFIYITLQVTQRETIALDVEILRYVIGIRSEWITPFMRFFSFIGSEGTLFGAILIVILLSIRKHRKETFIFSVILIIGLIATMLLKESYAIPRPNIDPLHAETTYSYPSGHAMNSLLFYSTLSLFVYHFTKSKLKALLSLTFTAVLIGLIGFSRVYLGVHYPSDVVAGYLAGLWLFVTIILVDKTLQYFKLIRETPKGN